MDATILIEYQCIACGQKICVVEDASPDNCEHCGNTGFKIVGLVD